MSKKRISKYILIVSVVAIALIIRFNMDTPTKIETVDNPLLKIIESEKTVVNIVDNSNNDIPLEIEEEDVVEEVEDVGEIDDVEDIIVLNETLEVDNQINSDEIASIQNISKKYNYKLTNLQKEFEIEFNALIQSAINDYTTGVEITMVVNMYMEKGYELEIKYDKKFYSVISDMELELKNDSHNTTLVAEVMNYYENFKYEKKVQLMNIGIELISNK